MTTGALPADLIRLGEAERRYGVPARTLRKWIQDGLLRKWKQGGYWVLVSAGEVERAAERRRRIEPAS